MANNIDAATLNRHGILGVAREIFRTLFHLAVLLVAAGNTGWINAWVFIGVAVLYQIIHAAVLARINPQVLNERGKLFQEGTKLFDRVFVFIYVPLAITASVVAGLDARYGWSNVHTGVIILGGVMYVLSITLSTWSMAANAHFAMTVRIHADRGQRVCTSGPYRFVRHPGYAAMLIGAPSYPIILGSWPGLIPAGAMILLFVIRTALEDRTLQEELPGYVEYTQNTRYRLVPFIW